MNEPRRTDILVVIPPGHVYQRVYTMLDAGQVMGTIKNHGVAGEMFDLQDTGYDNAAIVERIRVRAPRFILLVNQWPEDAFGPFWRPMIKDIASQTGIPMIAEGRCATVFHELIARHLPSIDYIIVGEPEAVLPGFLRAVSEGAPLDDVPGLLCVNGDRRRPFRPCEPARDLDSLPLAERSYLADKRKHTIAPILMNRNCRGRCTFCMGLAFRKHAGACGEDRGRSPEHVFEEMRGIADRFGIRYFSFCDDNFFGLGHHGRERASRLAELLIASGMSSWFYIDARVDDVERESFGRLRAAGLRKVNLGIESGSQAVLDRFHKGATVIENERAIGVLQKLNISPRPGFIMFEPRMSLFEVEENLDFLERTGLCGTFPVVKLGDEVAVPPGSELEDDLRSEGLEEYVPAETGDASGYRIPVLRAFRFRDARVAALRDATQLMCAELLRRQHVGQRILMAARQASLPQHRPETGRNQPDPAIDLAALSANLGKWSDGLSLFAFALMKEMLCEAKAGTASPEHTVRSITAGLEERLNRYDAGHLGYALEKQQAREKGSLCQP